MRRVRGGFTLLEVLIVIVIIGVLAGLAIPVMQAQVERSRSQEALASLGVARDSVIRYFAVNQTYVGATMPTNGAAGTCDYNPNAPVGGQMLLFRYDLGGLGASTFTITATRQSVPGNPAPAGGPHTVAIDQSGTLTKMGAYA